MLDTFVRDRIVVDGVTISIARAGLGPPVLLLHGYPQTHCMWHLVAPALAQHFSVVCADLRGYGDSDKPTGDATHRAYAKRTMASDQLAVMQALGFQRFALVGHDRGARVALRLALDHPGAVSRLALLDIVPTSTIYGSLDQRRAITVWRYFFLVQPPDLPERLIGNDPGGYLRATFDEWSTTPGVPVPEAQVEYDRCFDAASIHATCEDYRAGATIDLAHDAADADRQLDCPLLVLWSAQGIGSSYDVPGIWSTRAAKFRGRALHGGHFLAEEQPAETTAELISFLMAPDGNTGDGPANP
jgi:haloacetate dehalogenase